jgi:uncharacterized protein YigE (DUF2233 family)
MLRWIATLLALAAPPLAHADWALNFEKPLADLPGGAELIEREAEGGGRTVRIQGVFFSEKNFAFRVIDNPTKNQGTLGAAMTAGDFVAGTNGGYFHADWRPVGLAIAGGDTINGFERAKLLAGVFAVTNGKPRLVRSTDYQPSKQDTEALQSGPYLVNEGTPTVGLDEKRRARRTVIATDGKKNWALLIFSPVTLADTARLLASETVFPDFPVDEALNLDGGSSTALWAATPGKPTYLREIGSVRNYLGITSK